ncbi:hypothetical protein METSCH_A10870 [Metschnikowia aff. pulcherrima]|uniref:Uncharacterized protein n=1 Tax=Metschnikowia aff. pulcherrima TaxID=2163413 RepID=A0A4P6XJ16_9ASCO|nr:hypothetical protein METSCH_A10870 [Metschnikowia aff. pulcherrima]
MMFLMNLTGTMSQVVRLLAAGTDIDYVFYELAATHTAQVLVGSIDPDPSILLSSFMNVSDTEYLSSNATFAKPSIWRNSTIGNAPIVNNSTILDSGEANLNSARHESAVEKFYSHLQSFVFESSFDVSGFEEDYTYLQREFSCISKHLRSRKTQTKIYARVRFCRSLFQQMINLARLNKYSTTSRLPDAHLLYKVTEIHVLAFAMCNSLGEPDVSIVNFENKVMDLTTGLRFWGQKYNNLKNTAIKLARLFRNRVHAAENTLAHLSDHISFEPRDL